MMQALQSQPNTGPVIFLPNVVSPAATIEERAKQLTENLRKKRRSITNCPRMHLITHSFAGIDARAALSLHGADKSVQSLTTIATPHTGMRLIQNMRDRVGQQDMRFLEKSFAVVGLGVKNVNEFQQRNLDDFNLVAEDSHRVKYFSFGTKKREMQLSELLRKGFEIITEHKI